LYSPESPFNQAIPADARVDSRSSLMVQSLVASAHKAGFYVSVRRWTVPVYFANASTPRHSVGLTASWRAANVMAGVPIPAAAQPDPAGDRHLAILDVATGCEYDLYEARLENGAWRADWGNSIRLDSDGVYPKAFSARGSGFALLAGMIRPKELAQGRINHALLFSFDYTSAAGAVWPATETDGLSTRAGAIPMGARLQLDPKLDLDTLDLTAFERTIARALQEYGMILGDSGGGVSLYAFHPQAFTNNPYAGILSDDHYAPLDKLPLDRFRVLELGPITPKAHLNARAMPVPSGCDRRGRVAKIVDGDSMLVRLDASTDVQVHLLGITAPDGPCFGARATRRARALAHGRPVILRGAPELTRLRPPHTVSSRVLLGGGKDLGYTLLRRGLARVQALSRSTVPAAYLSAEAIAKRRQLGIWGTCRGAGRIQPSR
jgi:endonuclease YncB( thermonuclease family)